MEITVDRDLCEANAVCCGLAPAVFELDDDDNLVVMDHTWNKVWVINYRRDPAWLKPIQ